MREVLIIAMLFCSCQQKESHKKLPYDYASKQQLSYISKFMAASDSLKSSANKNGATLVNSNYQKWAIQYWKGNPQIERWVLQMKDKNSDDTAAFFTLTDNSIPVAFVSNTRTNSAIFNTIQSTEDNAYVIATGRINSSPSFESSNDTSLQRVYLNAVFDTIIYVKDSVQ
jgi:hypothetical protein